jgi:hypothetical protein
MAEISAPSVIGPATLDDLLNDQYERVARSSALAAANVTRVLSQSFGIPLNWAMHSEYDPRERLLSGALALDNLNERPPALAGVMLPGCLRPSIFGILQRLVRQRGYGFRAKCAHWRINAQLTPIGVAPRAL